MWYGPCPDEHLPIRIFWEILIIDLFRWLQTACSAICLQEQSQQQEVITFESSTPSSSYISTCRCLPPTHRTTGRRFSYSIFIGFPISRTAGQGVWDHRTTDIAPLHWKRKYTLSVLQSSFWVNGRRTSTSIMIHDILHKIAICFV